MQGEGRDVSKLTIPEHAIAEVRAALNRLKEKDIEEIASYMSSSLIKLIEKNNEIMNENPLIKLFQELMEEKVSDNIFSVDTVKAEELISGINNVELKNNLTEILDKAKNNDDESKLLLNTVIEKFSLKDK
ncbi:MAG: hypothetical protein EVJ48_01060 [Candidatus Acidulodesulfobacterium acidiphilum]|uniref:Uncharacterized protein n=1 Tax=Candidatus Acidulodesulfobacterium acidiphilum TaxID=2597224 RepID=A0A520XH89_9DELT|nr:MAG: hypothetical protein EVJ48_01060 [Candidatus Acidulodesulfobacterium acidiphilum]